MASAGSDDEQQPPQQNKWWRACISCLTGSPRAVATQQKPQPQPYQQEPHREEAPRAADQDTSTGPEEETLRREPERGVEEPLNTDLQSTKSKGKEKVGDSSSDQNTIDPEQLINTDLQSSKSKGKEKVGEGSDQNTIGVVVNDGPDNWRTCVVCRSSMDFRDMNNDVMVHKWSEVCNHHVCEECIAGALIEQQMKARRIYLLQIRDEDLVECPVQGCTHMLTVVQCRAFINSREHAEAALSRVFGIA